MILIREIPHHHHASKMVAIPVERASLLKRRWRAVAEDGTDFGFDLEAHLHDGAVIYETEDAAYRLTQIPEPVIEIALPSSSEEGARMGWKLGNLHFAVEVTGWVIRMADDVAIRQMLDREGIPFSTGNEVFHPPAAVGNHHHPHDDEDNHSHSHEDDHSHGHGHRHHPHGH